MRLVGVLLVCVLWMGLEAQITDGGDTLYGNEWIEYDKTYLKIHTVVNGVYKISQSELLAAGIAFDSIIGSGMALYSLGRQVPLYVSNSGLFGPDDYLLFVGQPNGDYLDRTCFLDPERDMLQPGYSMVNDTAAYFLTFGKLNPKQYTITSNLTAGLPDPEPWFWHSEIVRQTSNFIKRPNGLGSPSRFQAGDGFSGQALSEQELTIPVLHKYDQGPEARLEVRMVANNSAGHDLQMRWNDKPVRFLQFNFFRYIRDSMKLQLNDLQTQNRFRFIRQGPQENRYSLAYLELEYPRKFIMGGQPSLSFTLLGKGIKQLRLEDTEEGLYSLFAPEEGWIVRTMSSGVTLTFGIEQSSDSCPIVVWKTGEYLQPTRMKTVRFKSPDPDNAVFLMVYHQAQRFNSQGSDVIEEYRQYREMQGMKSYAIDIETLYDQFAYGIDRHFLAMRHYFAWLKKYRPNVEHIFLIGKGMDITHARRPEQWSQMQKSFFLPVFGVPGSDHLLVCSNHQLDQWFPIGRLPAITGDEISDYLEKVRAYELWQQQSPSEEERRKLKRAIHIHGGRNAQEQEQLRGILDRMRTDLESGSFAAEVFSFGKQSNEPVQGSAPERIYELINEGIGLISFLGHSGSTTLDFDIDNLPIYTNRDRYPLFFALGCSVGNIFSPLRTLGERFNMVPDKGTILFFSTSGLGYPATLEGYARKLYQEIGRPGNSNSFGKLIQEVNISNADTPNRLLQETIEQHVLNGDPSLKPHYAEKPDYVSDVTSVRINPLPITTETDTITCTFDILNIGSHQRQILNIAYELIYPDGRQQIGQWTTDSTAGFRNGTSFSIPFLEPRATGVYSLNWQIDPMAMIEEGPFPEAINNNRLQEPIKFFVGDSKIRPSYPPDLSILGEDSVRLYARVPTILETESSFTFLLDTTPLFEQPLVHTGSVSIGAIHVDAEFNLKTYPDSTTFYWKPMLETGDTTTLNTGEIYSFTLIRGVLTGKGMFSATQFNRGQFTSMNLDSSGYWRHNTVDRQYLIRNSIFVNSGYPAGFYDGQRIAGFFPFVSVLEGVGVVVMSPHTGDRWENPSPGRYGSVNISGVPTVCFPFATRQAASRKSLISMLKDSIPNGSTVLIYSLLRNDQSTYGAEEWAQDSVELGTNLFQILEKEGFSGIRELATAPGYSFTGAFVKGRGVIDFKLAQRPGDTLTSSIVVAEALKEGSFEWDINSLQSLESVFWKVGAPQGFNNGNMEIVLDNRQSIVRRWTDEKGSESWPVEQSDVVKLSIQSAHPFREAFQLMHWGVLGLLKPDLSWTSIRWGTGNDTLQQGAPITLIGDIRNLSNQGCPPFMLFLQVQDSQNNIYADTISMDSLGPLEQREWKQTLSYSAFKPGINKILLSLRAKMGVGELRLDNNDLERGIFVQTDESGPLLDVWIDGNRILDGDLVSSRPEIEIRLEDNQEYLRLDKPEQFNIQWMRPGSTRAEEIPTSAPGITYLPAPASGKNEAKVIYKPEYLEDGIHQLIVQGFDAQGNPAGRDAFRLRFEVKNQSAISALTNYPNPFSSQTRFVYTLSGNKPLERYQIRIYTLSGQLVRTLSHLELGPLKIGKQLTENAWDGRDQYGQPLANGVYLYRIALDQVDMENYMTLESSLDRFAEHGWSKLVILR